MRLIYANIVNIHRVCRLTLGISEVRAVKSACVGDIVTAYGNIDDKREIVCSVNVKFRVGDVYRLHNNIINIKLNICIGPNVANLMESVAVCLIIRQCVVFAGYAYRFLVSCRIIAADAVAVLVPNKVGVLCRIVIFVVEDEV